MTSLILLSRLGDDVRQATEVPEGAKDFLTWRLLSW